MSYNLLLSLFILMPKLFLICLGEPCSSWLLQPLTCMPPLSAYAVTSHARLPSCKGSLLTLLGDMTLSVFPPPVPQPQGLLYPVRALMYYLAPPWGIPPWSDTYLIQLPLMTCSRREESGGKYRPQKGSDMKEKKGN